MSETKMIQETRDWGYYESAEWYRLKARINRQCAKRCRDTYLCTGRASALRQAGIREACAAGADLRASQLEAS